jgi:hypothetical protein
MPAQRGNNLQLPADFQMPFEVLSYLPATMIIDPDLTRGACWPSEFVLVRLESQEQYGVILTLGTHGGEEQRREGKQASK